AGQAVRGPGGVALRVAPGVAGDAPACAAGLLVLEVVIAPDELTGGRGEREREQERREGPGSHQNLLVAQSPAPPGSGAGTIAVAGFDPRRSRTRKPTAAAPPAAATTKPARLTGSIGATLLMRALPAGVQRLCGQACRMALCFSASTTPVAIATMRPA